MYVDLGMEQLLGATRENVEIAVEIKSFLSASEMRDLENAVGQYTIYRDVLRQLEPERTIYLAVPQDAWSEIFSEPIGQLLIKTQKLRIIVYEPQTEEIRKWIPRRPIAKSSRKP